jgi:hypothetical protein
MGSLVFWTPQPERHGPVAGKASHNVNSFRVISNAPFDILFGRNLILSGDVNLLSTGSEPCSVVGLKDDEMTVSFPHDLKR